MKLVCSKSNLLTGLQVVSKDVYKRQGSRCGPFEPALRLLKDKKIHLPEIELYDLKDFEKAFASPAFKAGFAFID